MAFQSTRPIRGATSGPRGYAAQLPISIHAPHTGRDFHSSDGSFVPVRFQSTRPIRGATASTTVPFLYSENFNPRAPYGARLWPCRKADTGCFYFNPRAPYGARRQTIMKPTSSAEFQSTRPIRGATMLRDGGIVEVEISIHAPHTGRDPARADSDSRREIFQSTRPIRGATCHNVQTYKLVLLISIHAPHTGRDQERQFEFLPLHISIHAPHTGRDAGER